MESTIKFLNQVDSLKNELVKLTQGMIQRPSENPPGNELEVAEYIVKKMSSYGINAKVVESN